MTNEHEEQLQNEMRSSFEASLPYRLTRASRVQLQKIIPANWFATAASECAGMYIAGFFYGAISIAQAYIEALSRFLVEHHHTRIQSAPLERCRYLYREGLLSEQALKAALAIMSDRNDFHHLNKSVEQEYEKLEARAADCINQLHIIESEVFAYSFGPEPGKISFQNPDYWPSNGPGLSQVNLRKLW